MKFTPLHWAGLLLGAAGAGVAISKFEAAKKASPSTKAPAGAAATAKAIANAPKASTPAAAATASAPPAIVTPQQVAVSGGGNPNAAASLSPQQLSAVFAASGFNALDSKGP